MSQMNLLHAIKFVQDSFQHFTDKQLHTFHLEAEIEIAKRKNRNKYNPKISTRADNADNKEKEDPSEEDTDKET